MTAGYDDREIMRLSDCMIHAVQAYAGEQIPRHVALATSSIYRRLFGAIDKPKLCLHADLHVPLEMLVQAFERAATIHGERGERWKAVSLALADLVFEIREKLKAPTNTNQRRAS